MDNLNTMQRCTICSTELYSPWYFSVPVCTDCAHIDAIFEAEGWASGWRS
jgi:ribosomal protein S27E